MAQLDASSTWRPGGRGFNPRRGRQHSFVEIDHEIFSTVILSLPLIQEGQLSVSGELIVLGFNDTSTLMDHFVSSPREREKRDRRDSRRDEREGQGRKRNRNESEETEEMKTSPPYPYLLQG